MARRITKDALVTIAGIAIILAGMGALYYFNTPLKTGPWRVTLYTGNAVTKEWTVNTRPDSTGTGGCYTVTPDDGNVVIVCGNLTIERTKQ